MLTLRAFQPFLLLLFLLLFDQCGKEDLLLVLSFLPVGSFLLQQGAQPFELSLVFLQLPREHFYFLLVVYLFGAGRHRQVLCRLRSHQQLSLFLTTQQKQLSSKRIEFLVLGFDCFGHALIQQVLFMLTLPYLLVELLLAIYQLLFLELQRTVQQFYLFAGELELGFECFVGVAQEFHALFAVEELQPEQLVFFAIIFHEFLCFLQLVLRIVV